MDSEQPVQRAVGQKPSRSQRASWWSILRICLAFSLLFAIIFAATWYLTPIEPDTATLKVDENWFSTSFSPDGSMLVTSGHSWGGRNKGQLRVWDVAAGNQRISIGLGGQPHEAPVFSPDSTMLAFDEGEEGNLKLWNTQTGRQIAIVGRFRWWVYFRFSPDNRFLVFQDGSGERPDKDMVFWNIESQQEQGRAESYFSTLVFSPDGHTFATYRQKDKNKRIVEVLLWKLGQGPELVRHHRVTASADADLPGDYCSSVVAVSPDLMSFASADDLPNGHGEVVVWNMATGEKRWSATFNEHGTRLKRLSFMANGKILAAYGQGGREINWQSRTTLWDVASKPKEIGSYTERVTVSPDGEWLAIPLDSGARLFKVSEPAEGVDLIVNGDEVKCWSHPRELYLTVPSFSPDSKMLAVNLSSSMQKPDKPTVRVWDVSRGRESLTFWDCKEIWFSPDRQVLASLRNGGSNPRPDHEAIDLWNLPHGKSLNRILGWAVLTWLIVVLASWLGFKKCSTG